MWSGLAAEAYDRALPLGSSLGDVEFYREHLTAPALEAMCGAGRLMIVLFDEGLEIDGVDLSDEMVARARAKAAQFGLSPRIDVADIADFDMGRTYASIVVGVSSFLIVDKATARKALGRFHDHLIPGGTLWIDFHQPPFPATTREKQLGDMLLTAGPEVVRDGVGRQVETVTLGAETVTYERAFHVWSAGELRDALKAAGLAPVKLHTRPPFLVWEARRG